MSGYQFIHIESFGRLPGKGFKKQSMEGVVKEAERHPSACKHIETPHPPKLHYGVMPSLVVEELSKLSEQKKDPLGRKIRKDAQLLLAGVVSYPTPIEKLNVDDRRFQLWQSSTLRFLQDQFGENLRSILSHSDEQYFHFHFYVSIDSDNFHIRSVHPGYAAHDSVNSDKKKDKNEAYKNAMRQFQDDYYNAAGRISGLTRIGPKAQRITRKEWRHQQQAALRFSDNAIRLKKADLIIKKQAQDLVNRENDLSSKIRNYKESLAAQNSRLKQIEERESHLIESQKGGFISRFTKTVALLNKKINDSYVKIAFWRKRAIDAENKLSIYSERLSKSKSENTSLIRQNAFLEHTNDDLRRKISLLRGAIANQNNRINLIDNLMRTGKIRNIKYKNNKNHEPTLHP